MTNIENRVIKKKKLDKELTLCVSINDAGGRILVEFSNKSGKLVLQKSFQDTFDGRNDAKNFEKSIKNIDDLKRYFGLDIN